MKDLKKYLFWPLVFTVVLIAGSYFYGKQQNDDEVIDTAPAEIVEESIENGVYTNYTYGFRFEYPEEIFDRVVLDTTNLAELASNNVNYPYILDIYTHKYQDDDKTKPGFGPTLYFAAIDKNIGDRISQYDYKNKKFVPVGIKIADLEVDDLPGVFYQYEEMFEDYRLGLNYYSADWLKDDLIVSVKVASRSVVNLEKFKPQFESLIKTFQFIAPNN